MGSPLPGPERPRFTSMWSIATHPMAVDNAAMAYRWQLVVDASFLIASRGTVVVGDLQGSLSAGEAAVMLTPDGQSHPVGSVQVSPARGASGTRVNMLLGHINHALARPGTVIHSVD
jgi:selenocysteine-specific translation elongation factor